MSAAFTPTVMTKDGQTRTVLTWADYYEATWDGYVAGTPPEYPAFSDREKQYLDENYATKGEAGGGSGAIPTDGATDGQVLTADGAGGYAWEAPPAPPAPPVTSVNGETGEVSLGAAEVGAIPVGEVASMDVMTQAEYDALAVKEPTTLYLIQD